jgi:hypothetical protein
LGILPGLGQCKAPGGLAGEVTTDRQLLYKNGQVLTPMHLSFIGNACLPVGREMDLRLHVFVVVGHAPLLEEWQQCTDLIRDLQGQGHKVTVVVVGSLVGTSFSMAGMSSAPMPACPNVHLCSGAEYCSAVFRPTDADHGTASPPRRPPVPSPTPTPTGPVLPRALGPPPCTSTLVLDALDMISGSLPAHASLVVCYMDTLADRTASAMPEGAPVVDDLAMQMTAARLCARMPVACVGSVAAIVRSFCTPQLKELLYEAVTRGCTVLPPWRVPKSGTDRDVPAAVWAAVHRVQLDAVFPDAVVTWHVTRVPAHSSLAVPGSKARGMVLNTFGAACTFVQEDVGGNGALLKCTLTLHSVGARDGTTRSASVLLAFFGGQVRPAGYLTLQCHVPGSHQVGVRMTYLERSSHLLFGRHLSTLALRAILVGSLSEAMCMTDMLKRLHPGNRNSKALEDLIRAGVPSADRTYTVLQLLKTCAL